MRENIHIKSEILPDKLFAHRQKLVPDTVRQEPEIPDLHKPARQNVEKKSLCEHLRIKRQEFADIVVFSVFIREYDRVVGSYDFLGEQYLKTLYFF